MKPIISPLPESSGRVFQLEVCRGLAAMVVFFNHFLAAFFPHGADSLRGNPLFVLINGHAAVMFFFVLSGYVLTHRFYVTNDPKILVLGAAKRLPRLAGSTTLITIISCLLFITGAYHFREAFTVTGSTWLQTAGGGFPADFHPSIMDAFWQGSVKTFFRGDDSYNTNLWTMNIEFMGSLLVFALALPLRNGFGARRLLLGAAIATMPFLFTQPYYVAFVFGTGLAFLHTFRKSSYARLTTITVVILSLFFLSFETTVGYENTGSNKLFGFFRPQDPVQRTLFDALVPICGASMLIQLVACGACNQILDGFGMFGRFLGRASFSLYLCHPLVIWSFSSWMFLQFRPSHGLALTLALTFPTTILVVLALAWPLTVFDEWWTRMINRKIGLVFDKSQI